MLTKLEFSKILAPKGQKKVNAITIAEMCTNVTICCATNAFRNYIPSMFIFPRKRMTPLLEKKGPQKAIYVHSKNSWISEELFLTWLKYFQSHVKVTQNDPVLLVLDSHRSHTILQILLHFNKVYILAAFLWAEFMA
ncbi:DDE 1 domain containing protein [Asbolus verrucosus]|uniref:DDE 1 domain containing protein n=1 Tax=Asbolus verrucosus TaxID=1661398 RepID=A0A482V6Y4_ASBVE|nr:DDE 1 domain containing protein [Asbolus verrucosus]